MRGAQAFFLEFIEPRLRLRESALPSRVARAERRFRGSGDGEGRGEPLEGRVANRYVPSSDSLTTPFETRLP